MNEIIRPMTQAGARRRLVHGFGASALGPVTTAIIQVVSVPVFLRFWGLRLYGEWLVLSAIPTYLSLSDMGFGSVAGNDMTMHVARGNREEALQSFQSTWVFITALSVLLSLIVCCTVWFLPLRSWLHLDLLSEWEVRTVIVLLAGYAVLTLQGTLITGGFRCEGNYPLGMFGLNLVRLTEWTMATVVVMFGARPVVVAMVYLLVRAVGLMMLNIVLRCKSPWLHYGVEHADRGCVRRLAAPAFAFMAFPAGNAISIQGMIVVVGLVLGPIAVAAFATARTLTRFSFQILESIRNAIWPELSAAFGAENWEFARKLHRLACQAALWLCLLAVLFLAVAGPYIYRVWTHGRIPLDSTLFHCLLVVVVANSFWYTSSAVPVACNDHQRIAIAYLVGASASIAMAYFFLRHIGLPGAAVALLVIDMAMAWYVLCNSVRIVKDSSWGFLSSLVSIPPVLTNCLRANGGESR